MPQAHEKIIRSVRRMFVEGGRRVGTHMVYIIFCMLRTAVQLDTVAPKSRLSHILYRRDKIRYTFFDRADTPGASSCLPTKYIIRLFIMIYVYIGI